MKDQEGPAIVRLQLKQPPAFSEKQLAWLEANPDE